MPQGRKPELVGGGLIRSLGGWSQVLSLRRRGEKIASDERILGSSEFVQSLLDEVNEREKETLRLRANLTDLVSLAKQIGREEGITEAELRSGGRKKKISKARRRFCELAVVKMGYPGAQVARFLGVSTSAVVRAASSEELQEIGSKSKFN
ncbi:MAG: hypothetical protein ABII26_09590 [Pseudomonadota bacterium]